MSWPAVGRSVGVVVALNSFLFLSGAMEGRLFSGSSLLVGLAAAAATAFGLAAGSLVCHLVVGMHGFPPDASNRRTVRLSARQVTDYVPRAQLDAWRWSTLALALSLALGLALLDPRGGTGFVIVSSCASLALAAASLLVRRILLSRPMPGASREELVWEEALLGDSLQLITSTSMHLNATAAVLGLGTILVLREDLAPWGAPAAGLVAALGLVAGAARAWRRRPHEHPPGRRAPAVAS
jgi:hypothetical protein